MLAGIIVIITKVLSDTIVIITILLRSYIVAKYTFGKLYPYHAIIGLAKLYSYHAIIGLYLMLGILQHINLSPGTL